MLARINVGFIIATALGFILFFIVIITILFYIHHKKSARSSAKKGAGGATTTEGRYFQRLLTPSLVEKYFHVDQDKLHKLNTTDKLFDLAPYLLVIGAGLAIVVSFFVSQSHRFYKPIVLSGDELQALKYVRHSWAEEMGALRPDIRNFLHLARDKTFILIQNPDDQNWAISGSMNKIGNESILHWRHFIEHYRLKNKICTWKSLKKCRDGISKNVFIVLPGRWDVQQMDELFEKGASIWIYGPPRQLWDESAEQFFKWKDIRFSRSDDRVEKPIVFVGDRPLTLGFSPGEIIRLSQVTKGYTVESEAPDAISFDLQSGSNKIESRFVSFAQKKSRVVYSDFPPHYADNTMVISQKEVEEVVAAYLRFLLKFSFESIASWPQGHPSATLISIDINNNQGQVDPVLNILSETSVKSTFFLLSNWAEKFTTYIPKLNIAGEVACIADSQISLADEKMQTQLERLTLCQKVLKSLGVRSSRSLHPPFEKLSPESIDAAVNTGFSRIFGYSPKEALSPTVFTAKALNRSVVFVKRLTSGSYELFSDSYLSYVDAVKVVSQEQAFTYAIHGVYSYVHNTAQTSDEAFRVLKYVIDAAHSQKSYVVTLDGLAEWWSVRSSLMMGIKPTSEQLSAYDPQIVKVNEQGKIERRAYDNLKLK